MNNIVITGGSSGFGKSLAKEFIRKRHNVLLCGRSMSRLKETKEELIHLDGKNNRSMVHIFQCDVGDYNQVDKLGEYAQYLFNNGIDHWINGAAICEGPLPFDELSLFEIEEIIKTNLLGSIYGCNIAIHNKVRNVYVMSGHGSGGGKTNGFSIYGSSKAGLSQFAETLINEVETSNIHIIAPGLMKTALTERLFKDESLDFITKIILRMVAQDPKYVAQKIVPQILGIQGTGKVLRA